MIDKINKSGLYIHIPLCLSKCRYCDFYKVTPNKWIGTGNFLESLEIDLKNLPLAFTPISIFIGGGTPSALTAGDYKELMNLIKKYVDTSLLQECTSEANPSSLDESKIETMLSTGINRLSLGIQSFNNKSLKLLGRNHNSKTAINAFEMAKKMGFRNINIDMIQSIPNMNQHEINNDLKVLFQLNPDHISYYNLIYEPNTPITKDREKGKLKIINEDREERIYFQIKSELESSGYNHYEISNFAKKNKKCIHNLIYWKGDEYIGCGPSSHSHWKRKRFSKISSLSIYQKNLYNNESIIDMSEELSPKNKAKECLVMWLRLSEGVELSKFEKKTGFNINDLYNDEIEYLIENKLLLNEKNILKIPESKKFLSNTVFSTLV